MAIKRIELLELFLVKREPYQNDNNKRMKKEGNWKRMRERKERRKDRRKGKGREEEEKEEGEKGSTSLIALFLYGSYLILPAKDERP